MSVRVAVNGYGVIGKRVADAVRLQDDMELAGVADIVSDYRIQTARELDIAVYAASDEATGHMRGAGVDPAGRLEDLIAASDIVVDCTPKRGASANKERYVAAGRKAIFQGGEKHELTGCSFVASLNYADAVGRDLVRVVSCNTTGLGRVVGALQREGPVRTARACSSVEAPTNGRAISTRCSKPSCRRPRRRVTRGRTCRPSCPSSTSWLAAKGPFDLGHVHFTMVETTRATTVYEVHSILEAAARVAFVRADDGVVGQNSIVELMRVLGRPRGDLWEVALWEDALAVRPDGGEIYLVYHVANEAIVIPETIDAIRAMTQLETDGARSMQKTNASLGIRERFGSDTRRPAAVS